VLASVLAVEAQEVLVLAAQVRVLPQTYVVAG
jgi:hypothetical protein